MYEIATIVLGVWVVVLHRRNAANTDNLFKTTKALHMVALGKWIVEATEDEFTIFDDEGDKLMKVSKG